MQPKLLLHTARKTHLLCPTSYYCLTQPSAVNTLGLQMQHTAFQTSMLSAKHTKQTNHIKCHKLVPAHIPSLFNKITNKSPNRTASQITNQWYSSTMTQTLHPQEANKKDTWKTSATNHCSCTRPYHPPTVTMHNLDAKAPFIHQMDLHVTFSKPPFYSWKHCNQNKQDNLETPSFTAIRTKWHTSATQLNSHTQPRIF